ncbi:MAG: hypothetical protein NDM07_10730 [Planktothrix agardhii LY1]|uniref:hypothetical protein n=1 Tax=Planktothrix agardhii TaxID=1160 RepID=UPI00242C13B0|nr:hypothetical protein [Planktothrix agardhii]MCP9295142.1 hypothetical protein [Planktothrix agardhii LY1]
MAILIEPPQNELSALQNLSDSAGFLKKLGDGNYSIDNNNYLPLSGGTVTNELSVQHISQSGATWTSTFSAFGIDLGQSTSADEFSFIDFHSGGALVDFDARIQCTGGYGNGENRGGSLEFLASNLSFITGDVYNSKTMTIDGNGSVTIDGTYLGNGSGLTSLNASNISTGTLNAARLPDSGVTAGTYNNSATQVRPFSIDVKGRITSIGVPVNIYLPYQRVNMTEGIPPVNDSSPAVNTICNMGVFSDNGYPLTGHLFSSVVSSIRGIQIITNPLAPEFSYIRSRHTNFATGWSPWQKIAIENTNGIIPSSSGFSVGNNQVVSSRKSGWTAPTGTATRTTFATSTVTLPQLAERVKALIDDLRTHGLIGA